MSLGQVWREFMEEQDFIDSQNPDCELCEDSGELRWNPSPIGDPQCEESTSCECEAS